jgi:nitrous oxidase accessory protein NosD
MTKRSLLVAMLGVMAAFGQARAAERRVPGTYATIQAAVNAAEPGDVIDVGPGKHCGATIDRPVTLRGGGRATIVGCAEGPATSTGIRVGFRMPGAGGLSGGSGTHIEGFVFDGRGISAYNLTPLGFGIVGLYASDVRVERNRVVGTIQGITNNGGDRWVIAHNVIDDLTLFDCSAALCGGGVGIVVQVAGESRPEGNLVFGNVVRGEIPDGFGVFSMVGVFVFAADGTVVANNRLSIPDNPSAEAVGQGVLVANGCCGQPAITPGARNTVVVFNDARRSEIGVEIDGSAGENTAGLVVRGNLGPVFVEGERVDDGPRPRRRFAHRPHHPRAVACD